MVVAERSPVDLKITSSQSTLTSEEIENLPVQNLDDVVNLQAGVVDGHFRGGRQGEVQYQVDGVSVNNAFDNSSSLKIDRSLLQEVQVISGTFDAEYGQAMSGVVNAVLKQGTEEFQADAEVFTGGFFFPGREEERRTSTTPPHLTGTQNYQADAQRSGAIAQDHVPDQRALLPASTTTSTPSAATIPPMWPTAPAWSSPPATASPIRRWATATSGPAWSS